MDNKASSLEVVLLTQVFRISSTIKIGPGFFLIFN